MNGTSFFGYGASAETIRACLSLIERGCRREIQAEKMSRCSTAFASRKVGFVRKSKQRKAA